jgi:hypothetical protein
VYYAIQFADVTIAVVEADDFARAASRALRLVKPEERRFAEIKPAHAPCNEYQGEITFKDSPDQVLIICPATTNEQVNAPWVRWEQFEGFSDMLTAACLMFLGHAYDGA